MIKFVVDLKEKVICAGGGLHAGEEALLLEQGSRLPEPDCWEYKSMINIRPRDGNTSQMIQSAALCAQVMALARWFFGRQR